MLIWRRKFTQVIIQGEFVIVPDLNDQFRRDPELGFV